MKYLALAAALLLSGAAAAQQTTFRFENLSTEDILTIGRGLDKLPREETDRNGLYSRLQQQITAQNQARAQANKDAIDKTIADAVAAAAAKEKPPQEEEKP